MLVLKGLEQIFASVKICEHVLLIMDLIIKMLVLVIFVLVVYIALRYIAKITKRDILISTTCLLIWIIINLLDLFGRNAELYSLIFFTIIGGLFGRYRDINFQTKKNDISKIQKLKLSSEEEYKVYYEKETFDLVGLYYIIVLFVFVAEKLTYGKNCPLDITIYSQLEYSLLNELSFIMDKSINTMFWGILAAFVATLFWIFLLKCFIERKKVIK
ncbi:hypothetical protein EDD63_11430 [Breznakia blatticola]|uniref:Uncharacterized protein n=2 Tax=Breznakia TaxID=1854458 RepID=A0A4R7ZWY5_9FIRM|nr:hypothetical protein EDD63_11430 [Breznakia blatticola]